MEWGCIRDVQGEKTGNLTYLKEEPERVCYDFPKTTGS